ncbi:MAG: tryptophan-rich sensory protein [Bacillota bacterium]
MESNKKLFALPVFVILGYLLMVAVNTLSALLPLNGMTPGEISDKYPSLFVPAGITFSIWGPIYILLGIFTVFSAFHMFTGSEKNTKRLQETASLFVATCAANIMWIFTWHNLQILLSLMSMSILFLLLLYAYQQIQKKPTQQEEAALTAKVPFWHGVPFSVYFGWITVATIANVSAFLVSINWTGGGIAPDVWTAILIAVATAITLIILIAKFDLAYALVIVWALMGISIRHTSFFSAKYPIVLIVCSGCLTMLFAGICYAVVKTYKEP